MLLVLCIYVYVHDCMYVNVHVYVGTNVCIYVRMLCVLVLCAFVCRYVCYMCNNVCMYVCVRIYACVNVACISMYDVYVVCVSKVAHVCICMYYVLVCIT